MSEMIARVAAALKADFEPYRVFDEGQAESLARAAIEAMREPTGLMCEEAGELRDHHLPPSEVWPVMIEEALK